MKKHHLIILASLLGTLSTFVPAKSLEAIYTNSDKNYHQLSGFVTQGENTTRNSSLLVNIRPMPIPMFDTKVGTSQQVDTKKPTASTDTKSKPESGSLYQGRTKKALSAVYTRGFKNYTENYGNVRSEFTPVSGILAFYHKGERFKCSASLVSREVLLTAAHCICREGIEHTDFVYYPTPQQDLSKQYSVSTIFLPNQWDCHHKPNYDYAFLKLKHPIVENNVMVFNEVRRPNRNGKVSAFGYSGINRTILEKRTGILRIDAPNNLLSMTNNLQSGASGGPWITREGVIVGLNSSHLANDFSTMYSPYFSADFHHLLQQAKRRN